RPPMSGEDLIRRVCTDTLMIPMERTRAELSVDAREPSVAGIDILMSFPLSGMWPGWYRTLRTELAGYRTAERLMRSHSCGETTAAPQDPEPSVHSEQSA
ncbi:hypothetical protein KI387_010132, partial [Taxus chinensis]